MAMVKRVNVAVGAQARRALVYTGGTFGAAGDPELGRHGGVLDDLCQLGTPADPRATRHSIGDDRQHGGHRRVRRHALHGAARRWTNRVLHIHAAQLHRARRAT